MTTDKIIREWFYRLPKGYAEQPYTEEELAVLDEVMAKYQTPDHKIITEEAESINITDVKKLIDEADLDADELAEVQQLIVSLGFRRTILPYLASKGIVSDAYQLGARAVRVVFDRIAHLPNVTDVIEYFKSPPDLVYDRTTGRGNIVDASGLPSETIFELMEIQPGADAGGNSTGPAEIALALLFGNVDNMQGGGDLKMEGRILEVKGKEARLGSQARGKKLLESSFIGYMFDSAINLGLITGEEYDQFMNDTDHRNIAIAIRDAHDMLVTDNDYDKNEFIAAVQKGIGSIFFEDSATTKKYLTTSTNYNDVNEIMKQMVKINIDAYMSKIKADMILLHKFRPKKPDFDFVVVNREEIESVVESGTIRLGSKKKEGSFFWHDTNPGVVLSV